MTTALPAPSTRSALSFDAASLTAFVNELLAKQTNGVIRAVTCARVGDQARLTLSGVRTGLSVFGMAVPPIDADLLLRGTMEDGRLVVRWELEAVRGIPAMAAKLVGKPTLAKLLIDALGGRWGLDRALSADASGDLLLDPSHLAIPGWQNLQVSSAQIPGSDDYVVTTAFSWSCV